MVDFWFDGVPPRLRHLLDLKLSGGVNELIRSYEKNINIEFVGGYGILFYLLVVLSIFFQFKYI